MKFKLPTIFISVILIGLLIYGFTSLNSDDPYLDYAPGTITERGVFINNGNPADTTPPANWPYPTAWNFYYSGSYGGTVGANWFEGKYYNNRWSGSTWYRYLPNGPGGGPGDDDTITSGASGSRDMTVAPDGSGTDFLWAGTGSTSLRKFDKDGVLKGSYSISGANFRAIAWDPNRKGFWNASWDTDIRCHDTTGTLLGSFTHTTAINDKYGMAWDSSSSLDSAFLWVWHQQTSSLNRLTKIHLGSMTIVAVYNFTHAASVGIAGGAATFVRDNKFYLALNYQMHAIIAYELATLTPPIAKPEILYYTFDEAGGDSTQNFAVPGGGTPWAPVVGQTMGGSGQFGSALQGNGGSSTTNHVNTGWATDLGGSSWTISVWMNGLHSTTSLNYLWGDPTTGSWRCFYSGAAGTYGVLQRLNVVGGTDITIPGVGPGPTVLTLVYDSAAGVVKAYKNGVFSNQQTQAGPLIINGTGPFKVGGYSGSSSMNNGALMDEFRFYRRALDTAEISSTWNHTLITGGIGPVLNITPDDFVLSQNYPNPFNPTTTINFKVPVNGLVTLKVYDVTGKEVSTLINEVKNTGTHSIEFNATGLSSGVYFYKIVAGDFMNVKKMVLLK